jgi:hypothetical protein
MTSTCRQLGAGAFALRPGQAITHRVQNVARAPCFRRSLAREGQREPV